MTVKITQDHPETRPFVEAVGKLIQNMGVIERRLGEVHLTAVVEFLAELKRRNVFRVGTAYAVLGWVVIQVTDTIARVLHLPDWTLALVTWIGIIGFPFALFFARA